MSLWVLQLSDTHFGQLNPPLTSSRAFPPLVEVVRREVGVTGATLVVAICGDVVDEGRQAYYDTAAQALEDELLQPLGWPLVVCCPGNHDVVSGEKGEFMAFNRFAFRLTKKADLVFTSTATVASREVDGFEFVLINSMYLGHKDRYRGEVNIADFDRVTSVVPRLPRILVVHHSLIPNDRDDVSTLVNSYPLLHLAARRGFVAILHGHLHAQHSLTVGSHPAMALLGVGSLLFRPFPNYNNGFNLLRFENGSIASASAFRFVADAVSGGASGSFQKTNLEVI